MVNDKWPDYFETRSLPLPVLTRATSLPAVLTGVKVGIRAAENSDRSHRAERRKIAR